VKRGYDRSAKNKQGKTPAELTTDERLLEILNGKSRPEATNGDGD
jgi:hypothetical protein